MKTASLVNAVLMAELERKLPQNSCSPSDLNFPNFSYFDKIFGTHLQNGALAHLCTR